MTRLPALLPALNLLLGAWPSLGAPETLLLSAPSVKRYVEVDPTGETVLPNGRLITPVGHLLRVQPHPYGLALSPNGRFVVTANSGNPICLSVIDLADAENPKVYQIPEDPKKREGVLEAVFMGLAFDPSGKVLYAAGGRDWSVSAFDLESRSLLFKIDCAHETDGERFEHGYLGDMRISLDGRTLYAVDQSNFRMLIIDTERRKVIRSIPVGRYPFGIALSPDGRRAFVANVGMYEYGYIRDASGNRAMLDFPPFGVPSRESREGVAIGPLQVPALGDPNDIRGMSVFSVDVSERGAERVVAKAKTGHLVGEQLEGFPAVGGSSPNSIAVTRQHVFVSNGSNDSLTVLDAKTGERVREIDLVLDPKLGNLRGMIPFGVALSPDHSTLYVAEAGINAVGVVRLSDFQVLGHIPTAWFPSKLAVSSDGKFLYVSNAKGVGSGPNAGPNHHPGDPTGIGDLMRGYVSIIPIPSESELPKLTEKVVANNVRITRADQDPRKPGHPVPPHAGAWKSPIRHVVYVTKENRTYDEVFGALPGGRGDPELCRLGRPITVAGKDNSRSVENVLLMPNHIALARRYAINDNFYCDSDHSVDGHRWLVGTYPNEFMEARIGEKAEGEGPGNFAFIGSSGAIYPEDYNEAGSIWEHFERGGISFRNYGLGFEFAPQIEEQQDRYTGIRLPVNYPMPKPLFENTSRMFATYNTNIPDQFRMDMFEKEFKEKWLSGKEPFPRVITLMLPNDHGADERPEDGYPFWGSYMSDNDLALGRLVELLSHSPIWKETVIFVTEDDAQGYRDTVDAHRSICMVLGPYAKKGFISHTHSSIASILKTMFLILGLPPLNQYDGFASDLSDAFADSAVDLEPYNALPVDPRVFDPQKALDPFDADFNWKAAKEFVPLDHQPYLDTDKYGHSGEEGHGPREGESATPPSTSP
ncbi:MAG: bifunctional YncE family protein/alkaline phosphatase family protein [Candidatus Omnitrophica bacterium]|nr:bifunctional YncE family protein/alkaline phosphatase family protein [Candidatus Omnitrophota bacterium]